MIIVTGGAGFIGSNLIKSLNDIGEKKIILVDDLNIKNKKNVIDLKYSHHYSIDNFIKIIKSNKKKLDIKCIFHQGACSNTLEKRVDYIMKYNFEYSKLLLDYAIKKNIKFIYASSASVYGKSINTSENPENENPPNYIRFQNYCLIIIRSRMNSKIKLLD